MGILNNPQITSCYCNNVTWWLYGQTLKIEWNMAKVWNVSPQHITKTPQGCNRPPSLPAEVKIEKTWLSEHGTSILREPSFLPQLTPRHRATHCWNQSKRFFFPLCKPPANKQTKNATSSVTAVRLSGHANAGSSNWRHFAVCHKGRDSRWFESSPGRKAIPGDTKHHKTCACNSDSGAFQFSCNINDAEWKWNMSQNSNILIAAAALKRNHS